MALNPAQLAAATHPAAPLLIIAGAGTGKTTTLAHRVAHLMTTGAEPSRVLLLTFTRRAAGIMGGRVARALAPAGIEKRESGSGTIHLSRYPFPPSRLSWSGTFHAIANRLLRLHAHAVGLNPSFTVLDRSDSADLLNVVRNDLGFARLPARFPRKDTCLAIYSHALNTRVPLAQTLARMFPAYTDWEEQLKALFRGYVDAKQRRHILDYDDLLLYWFHLMADESSARPVRERFDHVLVDEYQDTNALQAEIVLALGQEHRSVTVVGDDAQAIYAFRGATVRNILDFPARFDPPAAVVKLERNYRSVQPILDATNAMIGKSLHSARRSEQKPVLVAAQDEQAQADYIADRVLELRESGVPLHHQAVLMRAAHHSDLLEIELARRNIPFVKYGGLKFLEAAHVKDLICILRWAENPRDDIAGFRVLQLLPGMGPAHARKLLDQLTSFQSLDAARVPAASKEHAPRLFALLHALGASTAWQGQVQMVRQWYEPHLERLHGQAVVRTADLETLEQLAGHHATRESFLSDLTLDPPEAVGDWAGEPLLDEEYLVLSTIHSAKGQEWDAVFVLNVVDGCIPSDMATGSREEIDEERRLLYVAGTRARDHLWLMQPQRFYTGSSRRNGDRHVYAPRTRFIPDALLRLFERATAGGPVEGLDVAQKLREMWA